MAGLGIRLFTDEMVNPRLAGTLVRDGYDAESCQWAGRSNLSIPDDQQLLYASQQGRAVLTFNIGDFERLDRTWKARGWVHAGIIISPQIRTSRSCCGECGCIPTRSLSTPNTTRCGACDLISLSPGCRAGR